MYNFVVKDKVFTSGTHVMGILNATPDSFYASSRVMNNIVDVAGKMLDDGAEILDIGGQSTRPGAKEISYIEEMSRVIPAIEDVRRVYPNAIISVDTFNSMVAREAVNVGADLINDVSGLDDPDMASLVKESGVSICAMHSRRNSTEKDIHTDKIFGLDNIIAKLKLAGVDDDRILLDAGIGFNHNSREDWQVFEDYKYLMQEIPYPFLLAASRKTFLGGTSETRLSATLETTIRAIKEGILFVRVHDVKENVKVIEAFNGQGNY